MTTKDVWTLPCMCYNPDDQDNPCKEQVSYPIQDNVVTDGITHSGVAIDAALASYYMDNFTQAYDIVSRGVVEALGEETPEDHEDLPKAHSRLKEKHKKLKEKHKQLKSLTDAIYKMTYGMTLDKDRILNVLGQKNCEGIRFYLCARKIGDDPQMHISVVGVGVDSTATDLNYTEDTLKKLAAIKAGAKDDDDDTGSLTLEYTTPPPPAQGGAVAKRYTLLQLAKSSALANKGKLDDNVMFA